MKKTLISLALIFCSVSLMAQSEQENLAKWINTYQELQNTKNWDAMIANFTTCNQEVPSWDFAYYYKGMAEFNKEDYQNAAADLNLFVSKVDTVSAAYMMIAQSYNALKQPMDAIGAIDKYIAKEPNDVAGYLEKANSHMELKDYTAYIADLTKVIELDNKNLAAYKNIASAYALQQNYQEAVNTYSQIIALDANNADNYVGRAKVSASLKTPEALQAALADYNKAEELGHKDADLYNRKLACHMQLKDYEGIVEDCNKLIELDSQNIKLYSYRANGLYRTGKYTEAIKDLDKIIDSENADTKLKINALNIRGACHQKLKDTKAAQKDAELIKQLSGK